MKITPEDWKRAEPAFTDALDLPAGERAAWLRDLAIRQPDVALLVAALLDSNDRAERYAELETTPRLAGPAPSLFRAGESVGPFRLLRPLGRGGMGEVWLAEQADGRLERQVALKLPTLFEAGDERARRFSRERDILAKLEHPNIARLYDAGVTPRGQPWLAMEYVEGEPLDAHARGRRLDLAARLGIARQVLAAVAHAHRHLVVHRDLKPANILIDRAGQVRLLDFGIAKLVGVGDAAEAPADLTRLGGRVMTLRYAAPEQVTAGEITTATDVYALGVVLHEFLAGASPYRAVREGRAFTEAALQQEDIARPSSLALPPAAAAERGLDSSRALSRRLAGDLDAILLKALRRDPAGRYATVAEFDEDIRRHLEHRPVRARAGTWRYLAGRFVRRQRLPLALAAGVVIALAAGLVMAERERARAERHFASVRQLANTFIFDVHGDIEKLPGSLAARQRLVKTSLAYLDSLAGETGSDRALQREVASAYRKIAEIEGDSQAANVGEPGAARRDVQKAIALLEALDGSDPRDRDTLRELRAAKSLLARLLKDAGDVAVMPMRESVVAVAGRAAALPSATLEDRRALALAITDQAYDLAIVASDRAAAMERIGEATRQLETLAREAPGDRLLRQAQADTYERASAIVEQSLDAGDLPRAIDLQQRSVELTEALHREDPLDQRLEQSVVKRLTNLADSQRLAGQLDAAAGSLARARAVSAPAWVREPGNAANAVSHLRALNVSLAVEQARGRPESALALSQEMEGLVTKLPEAVRSTIRVRANIANARGYTGLAYMALAGSPRTPPAERLPAARKARGLLAESRAFRQEMADRNLDAATSRKLVEQIGEAIAECDALIAHLRGGPGAAGT